MTQEKRENFMFTKDTIFYKKLWSLMLPMMLQNLMLALVAPASIPVYKVLFLRKKEL